MRKSSAILIALLTVASAQGEWQIVAEKAKPSTGGGIEYCHVVLENTGKSDRATLDIALIGAKSAKLRVIDNPHGADRLADAMRNHGCITGVNGGYFDPEFKPIGLLISEGVVISPLTRARLLRGILCSSTRGIEIVRLGEFSQNRKLDSAIESGPFLVDLGNRVHGLDDSRSAQRTFAAVARGGKATIGVCSEVTLAQLGDLLASISLAGDFKIWRAINLDGGSSSGFWFENKNGEGFSIPEEKTVRDFIGITPK